jgi:hypothetical protein
MGKMLVFTNPVDGHDEEYNEWYNGIHLKEVTATEPFRSAQRFRLSQVEGLPQLPDHRYLAIYEFEGPSQEALNSLLAASPQFQMSDALSTEDALVLMVEDL